VAWAAVALRPVAAYRSPGGAAIRRFGVRNANGAPTVFGVLARQLDARCRTTWLHVALPIRPNGASGWIRASAVREQQVRTRITVDLSARRLRLYRNARLVLSSPVAVGSRATPTPLGRYYVNQRLALSDPNGPYGPGAVGISAFSPVLTGWTQGGPIAIHGTNEPWSIGHAVSNGCVRLPNATLSRVLARAVEGTPVVIER
jgi:lipoprotein-anchoring transpeptidase ErfK/SrfK